MQKINLALHKAYVKTELVVPSDESVVLSCDNRFIAPLYISEKSDALSTYQPDEGDVELSFGTDIVISSTVYVYHTNLNKYDSTTIPYLVTSGGRGLVGQGSTLYKVDGTLSGNRVVTCNNNALTFNQTNCNISLTEHNTGLYAGNGASISSISLIDTGEFILTLPKGLNVNGTVGTSGQVLTSKGVDNTPEWDDVSANFIELDDTPLVYTGQASKAVIVKGDESGLEFGDVSSDNVYTADGALTGNRIVDIASNSFTVKSGSGQDISEFIINSSSAMLYGEHSSLGGGKASFKVTTDGFIQLIATGGLQLDNNLGIAGQVLTSQGSNQPTWTTISSSNVYNTNGALTAARTISLNNNNLTISGTNSKYYQNDDDITLSSNSESARLQVKNSGEITLKADGGLILSGSGEGNSGQVLISQGYGNPIWADMSSLYTADGTLTSVRTVSTDDNTLTIEGTNIKLMLEEHTASIGHPLKSGTGAWLELHDGGLVKLDATNGLSLNSSVGATGDILISNGSNQPTWSHTLNVTSGDGFTIAGTDSSIFVDSNLVYLGATSSGNPVTELVLLDTGVLVLKATNGLELDGSVGTAGQVLTSNGTGQPTWESSTNSSTEYHASNPTVTTNPNNTSLVWVNTTTGEIFSCTDDTTDNNVWEGQLGTKICSGSGQESSDIFGDNSTVARYTGNNTYADCTSQHGNIQDTNIVFTTGYMNDAFRLTTDTSRLVIPSIDTHGISMWIYLDSTISKTSDYYYLLDFRTDSTEYLVIPKDNYDVTFTGGTCYINGVSVASDTNTQQIQLDTWTHIYFELTTAVTNCTVTVGDYNGGTGSDDYQLFGNIDVITVFNRTLNSSEIDQLVNETVTSCGGNNNAVLNEIQTFTKPQCTYIDTTTTTNIISFNNANNFTFTATADNVTFTGGTVGQVGIIVITAADNITGWSSEFIFKTTPTLSGVEVFTYFIEDLTHIRMLKWS